MADFIFNIAKGRFARYCDLPEANDAVGMLLLITTGLEADATLIDYDTVAAVLGGASDEASFTGYSRMTLASVTVTVDDTNNRVDVDAADPAAQTNSSGGAVSVSKAIIYYDGDTTGGTDTNLIPLVGLDCVVTYDVGVPVTLSFNASGFARAA